MNVETLIQTTLESVSGLTDHVYPLAGLKNAKAPFAFYLRVTQDEEDALDGLTGLQEAEFELNFVAATYAKLVLISTLGQKALRQLQGTNHDGLLIERVVCQQSSPDLLEENVNLYRRRYRLQFDYQEVNEHE